MIWKVESINVINETYLINEFKSLNLKKQNKINKLLQDNDKKLSILGEIILRKLFNLYKLDYYKTKIFHNYFGKPYIKNKNIFFSISHSGKYAVGAISDKPIGIDIQKKRPISNNYAKMFCSKEEMDYIFENIETSNIRYFEIFSIKESIIKMLGLNINYLNNITITIKNGKYFVHDLIDINTFNHENYVISICLIKRHAF